MIKLGISTDKGRCITEEKGPRSYKSAKNEWLDRCTAEEQN